MNAIEILIQTRNLYRQALAWLNPRAFLDIPSGFDNNIAWNLGHVIVTQEALVYRLSGLPAEVTPEETAMYKTGTSPAGWSQAPDISRFLGLLETTPLKIRDDYSEGKFKAFRSYTTTTGVHLTCVEDALAFNNFHEGLHLGAILSLQNFINR